MPRQASPAARKLAEIGRVDLENVTATGKSGYITKGDVARYLNNGATAPLEAVPPHASVAKGIPHEDYDGEILPVSALFNLRFRQDDGFGEMVGEDLLAIRPKIVAGRFRSSAGVLGWYTTDRGYFNEPEETVPDPVPDVPPVDEVDPDNPPADTFGVSGPGGM